MMFYVFLYLLCRSYEEKRHEIQEFNFFFSSLMRGLGRHWGEISSSSWGKETDDQETVQCNFKGYDATLVFWASAPSSKKYSPSLFSSPSAKLNIFLLSSSYPLQKHFFPLQIFSSFSFSVFSVFFSFAETICIPV